MRERGQIKAGRETISRSCCYCSLMVTNHVFLFETEEERRKTLLQITKCVRDYEEKRIDRTGVRNSCNSSGILLE